MASKCRLGKQGDLLKTDQRWLTNLSYTFGCCGHYIPVIFTTISYIAIPEKSKKITNLII